MIIVRVVLFCILAIGIIAAFIRNTKKWASAFQQYLVYKSKKVFFGDAGAWEGASGRTLSTIIVVFLGLMVVVLAYVICFDGLGQ